MNLAPKKHDDMLSDDFVGVENNFRHRRTNSKGVSETSVPEFRLETFSSEACDDSPNYRKGDSRFT